MNVLKFLPIYFLLLISSISFTQTPVINEIIVEVSTQKIKIGDKYFFLHEVMKGQNIYRISKAYKISVKDIILVNPDAISGNIKERQILKIPTEPSVHKEIQNLESDIFIYHITEEQQTIFFITQKYKVLKEDLIKFNPELEFSTLQIGQVVRVPKNTSVSTEREIFRPIEGYNAYTVKPKETLFSISKANNITIDELVAANPDIKENGPKINQVIQIPIKGKTEFITGESDSKRDTIVYAKKPVTSIIESDVLKNVPIHIAFLLPLFIDENETLTMIDSANMANNAISTLQSNDIYQRSLNILEFYQGALLAIDSLKRFGINFTIHTFDTGKDIPKLQSILSKPEMAKMNLIIGPFYTEQVEKTAEFAKKNKIKLVSPVSDSSSFLQNNPYVSQVVPNEKIGIDAMVKYISTLSNKNIIIISTGQDLTELYRSKLIEIYKGEYKVMVYTPMLITDFYTRIESIFSTEKENIVILPTENKTILTDLISKLNVSLKLYPIVVFGTSSIKVMEKNIEQEFLHNIEYHYASTFYTDFNATQTQRFLKLYKYYYKTEPTYHRTDNYPRFFTPRGYNFGMLGYDITYYFSEIAAHESGFRSKYTPLHTNFNFEPIDSISGEINKGINIVKYSKNNILEKVY